MNISGGQTTAVTPIRLTPALDTVGPVINTLTLTGATNTRDLLTTNTAVVDRDARMVVTASDLSGVSRVEFLWNGRLQKTAAFNPRGEFTFDLVASQVTDGDHTMTVVLYDSLDNRTEHEIRLTVALAPPAAPVITSPTDALVTNELEWSIIGTAERDTQIQLYHQNEALGPITAVDFNGQFVVPLRLTSGNYTFTARAEYPERGGFSPPSATIHLTVDQSVPAAPEDLHAVVAAQGEVKLSWRAVSSDVIDNPLVGYRVYRSAHTFESINETGVSLVRAVDRQDTFFNDVVLEDGTYYYRVAAVNQSGTVGLLSRSVQVRADSQPPKALSVTYTSQGLVHEHSGALAPGDVAIRVQFSEPLRNKPHFTVVPEQGVGIVIDLRQDHGDGTVYTGHFTITPSTPSGTAYAVLSHDAANNQGTTIEQGASLLIDTDGPNVTSLILTPKSPLRVDAELGRSVDVQLHVNEAMKAGEIPRLIPLLNEVPVVGYEDGIALNLLPTSMPNMSHPSTDGLAVLIYLIPPDKMRKGKPMLPAYVLIMKQWIHWVIGGV